MAYVYKQRDRDGNLPPLWRFKFRDRCGKWKSGLGWRDKLKTMNHARDVEAEERAIGNGTKEAPTAAMEARNTPITTLIDMYLAWGNLQGGRGGIPWDNQNAALKKTALTDWVTRKTATVLSGIQRSTAEKVKDELLASGLKAKTVELRIQHLKAFVNWCVRMGYLNRSPLIGLKAPTTAADMPHRQLTDSEVAALLKAAPTDRRLWYDTALETGLRVNELRALKVCDLDVFAPTLHLAAEYSKDRKEWFLPITRSLADRLAALSADCPREQKLLGIPSRVAGDRIADDYEAAGITLVIDGEGKATWHSLRKVFINNVVKAGHDLKTIMTLARHSTATMSMETYAKPDTALIRAAQSAAVDRVTDALITAEAEAACHAGVNQQVVGAEGETVTSEEAMLYLVGAGENNTGSTPVARTN